MIVTAELIETVNTSARLSSSETMDETKRGICVERTIVIDDEKCYPICQSARHL